MAERNIWETWHLPTLDDVNRVLPSAEKEAKDKQKKAAVELQENESIEEVEEFSAESVEEVDAAQVHLPSAEELEQIRKSVELEAYREGFEKGEAHGRESGYNRAYEETKSTIESRLQHLLDISQALQNPIDDQDQAIEEILLKSVVTIAKAVIGRELRNQPEQISAVVKQAVSALPHGDKTTKIFIHPNDFSFIEQHVGEHPQWQLLADEQITPGGCRVETSDSMVDATVESRIQAAVDQFLGKELATGQDSSDAFAVGDNLPQG